MHRFDFKNRQGLEIGYFLIALPRGKRIPYKIRFESVGLGKALYNQAFLLILNCAQDNGFGFDLHRTYRIIITFLTLVSTPSCAVMNIM